MKYGLILVFGLVLVFGTAKADTIVDGFSVGYGRANSKGQPNPDIDIYRVGLKKDFSSIWFKTRFGYLSGYYEISYNQWKFDNQGTDEVIHAVGFSPVFKYFFGSESYLVRPYIEAGIGLAYLDEYTIAGRNLSSNFQFEDRVGLGARIGFIDLNFRFLHYSNADLEMPNHGIDILILSTTFYF